MSDHVLVIPAEEWSCNRRMRGHFDKPEFGKARSEAIATMLLWMDIQAEEPRHMIVLPMPVAKPRLPEKVGMAIVEPRGVITRQDGFSSYKVSVSIAAVSALASVIFVIDGSYLPVLVSATATICFGCLGYAQRLIETKIAESLGEKKRPTSVK